MRFFCFPLVAVRVCVWTSLWICVRNWTRISEWISCVNTEHSLWVWAAGASAVVLQQGPIRINELGGQTTQKWVVEKDAYCFPRRRQQKALNPEFIFTMNNKQAESPLITEQIRVLALQTLPGGRAGPEARVASLQSQSSALFKLCRSGKNCG